MADVDMTDAPGSAAVVPKKKGVAVADADSKDAKKRFEVKKVRIWPASRDKPAQDRP